ncbi:MAG: 16S rRNA (cytosine(1402)-N(4))-methyltransferase RsmH [Anaerococcus sp.]|nr:16S rRNA (cytosine(1402)-N(4))-methyltransferase RsmH [Anaerococcus sp.]
MKFEHIPVLAKESIENLNIRPDGTYLDLTLGKGGHSKLILENLGPEGRLIGFDQDKEALAAAKENLKEFTNADFINSNFEDFDKELDLLGIDKVDGVLMDIGVSSYQIDNSKRGFSYINDGPLDMRMNQENTLTAEMIVNEYSKEDLARIFFDYGEEKFSRPIANNIVKEREKSRIDTTLKLAKIVRSSFRSNESHPEKRVFQALRIEVNRELEVLENTIDRVVDRLNKKGRLAIITFHSLEDRIVKNKFNDLARSCICPKDFPVCVCNHKAKVKLINKKPISASARELKENSRAKPAKLRVCVRI